MLIKRHNHPLGLFNELFEDLTKIYTDEEQFKVPVYDIIENDREYLVEMLLAGIKREDINLHVDGENLIITAERKEIKDNKYNRKQSYFGKYKKTFILPEDVDKDKIDASLSDGVLSIQIPKAESKKLIKSKIEIK